MHRTRGVRSLLSLLLAGCVPAAAHPGQPTPGAPDTGTEAGTTHHAVIHGTVAVRSGAPAPGASVTAWRLVEPQRGSMPQTRTTAGADGTFTLPIAAFIPRPGGGDTAVVEVILRAAAPTTPGAESSAADSARVRVTLVPHGVPALHARARIVVPR